MNSQENRYGAVGLINMGNTCFINAGKKEIVFLFFFLKKKILYSSCAIANKHSTQQRLITQCHTSKTKQT